MIKLQLDCRNGVMEKKLSKIGENRFFDRNVEKMNDFAFLGIIKAAKLLSPPLPPSTPALGTLWLLLVTFSAQQKAGL